MFTKTKNMTHKMSSWKSRLFIVCAILTSISLGCIIIIKTFNDNILFFYSPSDIYNQQMEKMFTKSIRVGGYIKNDSVKIHGSDVNFIITDHKNELCIIYKGILPNLFKEGQASIAYGRLIHKDEKLIFLANEILAKHDENYIPKEIANIKADKVN